MLKMQTEGLGDTRLIQMNRILGRTDLVEQLVVGFPQWPPKAHKSLASFAGLQIAYKGNTQ